MKSKAALFALSVFLTMFVIFAGEAYSQKAPGEIVDIGTAKMHIYCMGKGGPTVILESGAGGWSIHWSEVQKQIAERNRVCSYDRPGLGWSSAGVMPRTAKQDAIDLNKVLVNSGEKGPFVLVGTSFGGYIVRIYHDMFPDEVVGIALIESGHEDQWEKLAPTTQMLKFGIKTYTETFRQLATGEFKKEQLPSQVSEDLLPLYQEAMARKKTQDAFLSEMKNIDQSAEQLRATKKLGDLPLIVLSAGNSFGASLGTDDKNRALLESLNKGWIELQNDLASLSTNTEHLIIPNAKHSITTDNPRLVANSVELLLEMVRSTGRSAK